MTDSCAALSTEWRGACDGYMSHAVAQKAVRPARKLRGGTGNHYGGRSEIIGWIRSGVAKEEAERRYCADVPADGGWNGAVHGRAQEEDETGGLS